MSDLGEGAIRFSSMSLDLTAHRLVLSARKSSTDAVADLSNEQRQAIFAAADFTSFIEESTKIVQRALSDGYDYIRDYTVGLEGAL